MKKILLIAPIGMFFTLAALNAGAQSQKTTKVEESKPMVPRPLKEESKVKDDTNKPDPVMQLQTAKPVNANEQPVELAKPAPLNDKNEEMKVVMVSEDSKKGMKAINRDKEKISTIKPNNQPATPSTPPVKVLKPEE